jgi:hypothetical protein
MEEAMLVSDGYDYRSCREYRLWRIASRVDESVVNAIGDEAPVSGKSAMKLQYKYHCLVLQCSFGCTNNDNNNNNMQPLKWNDIPALVISAKTIKSKE